MLVRGPAIAAFWGAACVQQQQQHVRVRLPLALPGAARANSRPLPPLPRPVLTARSDCSTDCRQQPYPLAPWPQGILNPADGRYTPASDLCLVSHCLMSGLPFPLSASGEALKLALAAGQLSAERALAHKWLVADMDSGA